jgi:hypothetical protein
MGPFAQTAFDHVNGPLPPRGAPVLCRRVGLLFQVDFDDPSHQSVPGQAPGAAEKKYYDALHKKKRAVSLTAPATIVGRQLRRMTRKKKDRGGCRGPCRLSVMRESFQAFSSRICFFTLDGTSAYFSGSIALAARPVLIDRSSVV